MWPKAPVLVGGTGGDRLQARAPRVRRSQQRDGKAETIAKGKLMAGRKIVATEFQYSPCPRVFEYRLIWTVAEKKKFVQDSAPALLRILSGDNGIAGGIAGVGLPGTARVFPVFIPRGSLAGQEFSLAVSGADALKSKYTASLKSGCRRSRSPNPPWTLAHACPTLITSTDETSAAPPHVRDQAQPHGFC